MILFRSCGLSFPVMRQYRSATSSSRPRLPWGLVRLSSRAWIAAVRDSSTGLMLFKISCNLLMISPLRIDLSASRHLSFHLQRKSGSEEVRLVRRLRHHLIDDPRKVPKPSGQRIVRYDAEPDLIRHDDA